MPKAPPESPRVLIVDDEPDTCRLLEMALQPVACTIRSAHSGKDALELLRKEKRVALVISDLYMPEMDGIRLLERVRQLSPDTRRILLTGQPDLRTALDALDRGVISRLVTKPWDMKKLQKTVQTLLEIETDDASA